MLFLPFCNPVHPIFGASSCEVYSYSFYRDAVYFLKEDFLNLPNYSHRVRTDLYSQKLFLTNLNFEKVGVRFSSPNFVGTAFTQSNAFGQDYAFGFHGRWRNWGAYAYRGREYPVSGEGAFLSFSWHSLSVTGGFAEGGPSGGFQLGNRYYVRGVAYAGSDTLLGVGAGIALKSYDLIAVFGDGALVEGTYVGILNVDFGYVKSRKMNVGRLGVWNSVGGIRLIAGEWYGYSGYELQTYLKFSSRFLRFYGALSLRDDSTYTFRVRLVPLPFSIYDILIVEPEFSAYKSAYKEWYSPGLSLTFYGDVTLSLFYDFGTYGEGIRAAFLWTLWD